MTRVSVLADGAAQGRGAPERPARRLRRDDGVTLVELLLALTIFAVISAIGVEIVNLGFQTHEGTERRLNHSNDQQRLTSSFTRDVQNAAAVATTSTCAPSGNSVVIALSWTQVDAAGASVARDVVYSYLPPTGATPGQLVRSSCSDGVRTDDTLGLWLDAAPTVACLDAAYTSGACGPTTRTVRLTVSTAGDSATVTGARRLP